MKRILISILLVTFSLYSIVTFDKNFEEYSLSKIFEISSNDGYIAIGSKEGNSIFLILDVQGNIIEEKEYNFQNHFYYHSPVTTIYNANNCFISLGGITNSDSSRDIFIIKYDISGDTISTKRIDHSFIDYPSDILALSDNEYYMTFIHSEEYSEDYDPVLSKINEDGEIIWFKEYDSEYRDSYIEISANTNENYFLTITRGQETSRSYGEIIKINSYGDSLFSKRIESDNDVIISSNISTFNNNQVVTGGYSTNNSSGFSGLEMLILKFNSDGDILWDKYFGDGDLYSTSGLCIINTNDSGYIIGGFTNENFFSGMKAEAYIFKIDQNGNEIWSRVLPYLNLDNYVVNLLQTSDNGYICCINYGEQNTRLIKLDESGNVDIRKNEKNSTIGFNLNNNYPNPFNPFTRIDYELANSNYELAEIIVYNVMGQIVFSLPITHHGFPVKDFVLFDGSKFNSGTYYCSLVIDGKKIETKSMVLVK